MLPALVSGKRVMLMNGCSVLMKIVVPGAIHIVLKNVTMHIFVFCARHVLCNDMSPQ